MGPLERFGKWFDSLWENKTKDVAESHEPVVASRVRFEKMTLAERILATCKIDSDTIAVLKIVTDMSKQMGHEYTREQVHAYRWDGEHLRYSNLKYGFGNGESAGWESLTLEKLEKQLLVEDCPISFDLKFHRYGIDIPKFIEPLARNTIASSRPWTALHTFREIYATKVTDNGVVEWVEPNCKTGQSHLWAFDTQVWYRELKDTTRVDKPTYVIIDKERVDRFLLPHTYYRRWVHIAEVEDATKNWTVRVVPRNLAQGKIRYFRFDIDFDAMDLGGVSMDVATIIYQAIRRIHIEVNDGLPDLPPQRESEYCPRGEVRKSNVYVNYDNITVKHKDVHLSLVGYIKCQVKPVFHDNNPFLNPEHGMVEYDRNFFRFTHEFKTVWGHKNDFPGDGYPDAK